MLEVERALATPYQNYGIMSMDYQQRRPLLFDGRGLAQDGDEDTGYHR